MKNEGPLAHRTAEDHASRALGNRHLRRVDTRRIVDQDGSQPSRSIRSELEVSPTSTAHGSALGARIESACSRAFHAGFSPSRRKVHSRAIFLLAVPSA